MSDTLITPLGVSILAVIIGLVLLIYIACRWLYRGVINKQKKHLLLFGLLLTHLFLGVYSNLSDDRPFKIERWYGLEGGPVLAQEALYQMHPPGSSLKAFRHTMNLSDLKLGFLNKTPREAMGRPESKACCVTTYYEEFPVLLGIFDAYGGIYVEYDEEEKIIKTTIVYRGFEWI